MKKLFQIMLSIVGLIFLGLTVFVPDLTGNAGVISAAMFITSSVTWGGKETLEYFIRPMFIGKSPWETQGVRVIPNVANSQKLNYFGTASKILKAYAKGFTAATGTTYTQRTLTVERFKAEAADDAQEFFDTVYEQALNKGDWNNLTGTELDAIILSIYQNALKADIYRIFWMADPYKETVVTTFSSGVADVDYNQMTGMWKLIFDNASTSPSDTQIKRIAVTDGAVAQQVILTFIGTNGSGTVTFNGVAYAYNWASSNTATASAWVVANSAALLLRHIQVVDHGDGTVHVTSTVPGEGFSLSHASVSGDADITHATGVVANTAPSALSAGESEDLFLSLFEGCDIVLKNIPANEKILLVDRLIYENYQTYLETLSTVTANTKLENGVTLLTYRGIPVIPMEWSNYLNADFPHLASELPAYPHRIIYTQIGNLALGFDVLNQFTSLRRWYAENEEENRFRAKLKMGAQYVHNKLMAVAY